MGLMDDAKDTAEATGKKVGEWVDDTKERIVRHTVSLANDFDCETILEGVESAHTALAAAAMGVTLAQGFHFGRPSAAGHWLTAKPSLWAA